MTSSLCFLSSLISGVLLLLGVQGVQKPFAPVVHRHASGGGDAFVNAYLVETAHGVVAVDATMTVAESARLRSDLLSLHKPLLAVLITHGHPDHYGGVTGLLASDAVPVIATRTVDAIIRRDDRAKDEALKRAGVVWAQPRTFPNRLVDSGQSVAFDGVRFTPYDAGPGESHADCVWLLESPVKAAFVGDLAINHVHAFLADGHSADWLKKLGPFKQQLQDLGVAIVYTGHGEPGGLDMFDWTRHYIDTFRHNVRELAAGQPSLSLEQKTELSRRMAAFLPEDVLAQFVTRGADVVAAELVAGR
jgi:glyoxylase-like metal-dependent hydrolase (beta-lactamase superfamily II)